MISIKLLEAGDIIHPDDYYRPLLPSCYVDPMNDGHWHDGNIYGGGPLDHMKWAPVWLILGEPWWGKKYGEYSNFSNTVRPYEAVRGNIPATNILNVEKWNNRHPLWWSEVYLKRKAEIHNTVLTFGKYKNRTIGWVEEHYPDYYDWLLTAGVKGIADKLRFIKEYEGYDAWYRPNYRKFSSKRLSGTRLE